MHTMLFEDPKNQEYIQIERLYQKHFKDTRRLNMETYQQGALTDALTFRFVFGGLYPLFDPLRNAYTQLSFRVELCGDASLFVRLEKDTCQPKYKRRIVSREITIPGTDMVRFHLETCKIMTGKGHPFFLRACDLIVDPVDPWKEAEKAFRKKLEKDFPKRWLDDKVVIASVTGKTHN